MFLPRNELFKDKTFFPLFITQFLGAFTDNTLKSAFSFLVAFGGLSLFGLSTDIALMLGAIIYIAPFLMFSGVSGALNDQYDKATIVQRTRLVEIGLAVLATGALFTQSGPLLLLTLFLYAVQSTVFGPAKYSILPQMLARKHLVSANALFESSTFIAILLGLLVGGYLAGNGHTGVLAGLLIAGSALSYVSSLRLPSIPSFLKDGVTLSKNPVTSSITAVKAVLANRTLLQTTLAIAWFWAIGLVVISTLPGVAKDMLNLTANAANILVAAFVIGIGLGTFAISKLLKGDISPRHVPFGVLGMAVFLADFGFALQAYTPPVSAVGVTDLLASFDRVRILFDMVAVAFFGAVFTVPLYAIFQTVTEDENRSTAIAGSNILNSLLMVAVSLAATGLLAIGFEFPALLFGFAALSIVLAGYLFVKLASEVIKSVGASLLRTLFKARVKNLEGYGDPNAPAVVIANHVSYLDAVLLGCLLPGRPAFAINTQIAKAWWVRPAFLFFDLVTVDPTSPLSVRKMVKQVRDEKRRLIIFPEGRLTRTGALMKVYDGPAMIAEKAGAPLIPIHIEGAQFSKVSYLNDKLPTKWFPEITLTVLEKQEISIPEGLVGRKKRAAAASALHEVMAQMVFDTKRPRTTLFESLIDAKTTFGTPAVLEDMERTPISYDRIIAGSFILGAKMTKHAKAGDTVGLLLPNSNGCVVSFFACQAYGFTPAMLNFTAGRAGIQAAITAAEIKSVFTSRRFVDLGKLDALIEAVGEMAEVVYLEDIREEISTFDKVRGFVKAKFPKLAFRMQAGGSAKPEDKAVVLFTSGSEGLPKGVVLSHANIQANRNQVSSVIDFSPKDKVLNALPMFHSFGLTAGTLLPLLSGVPTFLYPSPLHYRIVPEIAYDTNATVMFGTDTFLSGYARMAHAYDFYSLRYVFAGAERVRPETRQVWSEKFGLRVLEGYGTTETAPVLSINTPLANVPGTVGRLLPGMEARLEPVTGVEDGGRLHVTGPNVMMGYLKVDNPGVIQPPVDGWHDTGDIVSIDDKGFITIKGRVKRFAKIGGEMVSLTAVESLANELWPETPCCAVALPHEKKGEQIVLLCEGNDDAINAKALLTFAKSKGIGEIMVPKTVFGVDAIPLLGTGKLDIGGANRLAADLMGTSSVKAEPSAEEAAA
ncbi:MAG: acyl-[ACP]--phospholipid O-acyltransferase [Pseudomonadota bacterium]